MPGSLSTFQKLAFYKWSFLWSIWPTDKQQNEGGCSKVLIEHPHKVYKTTVTSIKIDHGPTYYLFLFTVYYGTLLEWLSHEYSSVFSPNVFMRSGNCKQVKLYAKLKYSNKHICSPTQSLSTSFVPHSSLKNRPIFNSKISHEDKQQMRESSQPSSADQGTSCAVFRQSRKHLFTLPRILEEQARIWLCNWRTVLPALCYP